MELVADTYLLLRRSLCASECSAECDFAMITPLLRRNRRYTLRCSALDMDSKALTELESYANLAFTQFRSPLFDKYAHGKISGRQLLYFHAACRFTHYFEYVVVFGVLVSTFHGSLFALGRA